jgi:hypothetical protein
MVRHHLLFAAVASAALAACSTSSPSDQGLQSSDVAGDIVIAAEPDVEEQQRVTLNSKEDAAGPDAGETDRVVVTGVRAALRSGNLSAYLRALSDASCGAVSGSTAPETINLRVNTVAEQSPDPTKRKFGELTFIGSYQLSSSDPRFGGLSGLDVLSDDTLLAVSDAGRFVWIDVSRDGVIPVAARLAPMRDAEGKLLDGDSAAGSEGLAVNGGMALVSFEGEDRVLSFDIGRCGASARGAPIVFDNYGLSLRDAFDDARVEVDANNGSEPLAVTNDWYMFAGIEKKVGHFNFLSGRPIEAEPDFNLRVGVSAPEFAGLDLLSDQRRNGAIRAFLVHRSADNAGSPTLITETDMIRFIDPQARGGGGEMGERARWRFSETGWREMATLDRLETTESYEGIAAKQLPDGRVRLYLISDDDFDGAKRTVLTIFDAPKPSR